MVTLLVIAIIGTAIAVKIVHWFVKWLIWQCNWNKGVRDGRK